MFCNKCGNENVVGSMFCNKCGNKLIDVPDECKDINLNVNNTNKSIFKETFDKNMATLFSGCLSALIITFVCFILFIFIMFLIH